MSINNHEQDVVLHNYTLLFQVPHITVKYAARETR
jgi:hypothetical protein